MAKEFNLDDWQDFEDDAFLSPRLRKMAQAKRAATETPKSHIARVTLILCSLAFFLAVHFMTESMAEAAARDEGFRSGFHASQREHPGASTCIPGN